ncbi:hypothetical protein [Cupriavidus sp. CuC1]|uniref:hypothetical protein n=1 Tax=Cupriavidus sp. CuC1 TaxID=3373131 RepID=UPI0037D88DE7
MLLPNVAYQEESMPIGAVEHIMHIGPVAPVDEQPQLTLERWRVYETSHGDRHFIGYCVEARDSRVTTPILSFDAGAKTGVTASGRRYLLTGWPCFDSDAERVWSFYASHNGVTETKDVSVEYLSQEAHQD